MPGRKPGVVFYVATTGNDNWSGKLDTPTRDHADGPFATLERARAAIRQLKAGGDLKQPATVMVRGGKYLLEDTLKLGPKDGGGKDCPVTYTAYPGETPILSGGRRITGWKPYKDNILQCEVPGTKGGGWKFRQLFLNGKRQIRARWPNFEPDDPLYGGYARIEGAGGGSATVKRWDGVVASEIDPSEEESRDAFRYMQGTFPHRWAKPTQGEVFTWSYHGWGVTERIPIRSIDEENRIIKLAREVKNFDVSPWFVKTYFMPGNRFYVENLLEELDQPGEWCLDTEDGIVYFWPPCEEIENAEVVAPHLKRLIDLQAAHVTISGFTLTETDDGDCSHPTRVEGLGAMFSEVGLKYCGEAIRLKRAEHCVIENSRIHAVGGNGIYIELYNRRNKIRRNEISEAGANGIVLAGSTLTRILRYPQHPLFTEVTDNRIHHCGVFDKFTAGVFLGRSEANTIGHNLIYDLPHHGICLGNDGYGRNIVEYNRIHHVCLETRDTGAINTWMEGPTNSERSGHVIRFNFISDIGKPDDITMLTRGIYLDNEPSNCFVYGNIVTRCPVGFTLHGGKNNIIENNIFMGRRTTVKWLRAWTYDLFFMSNRISGNILCRTGECDGTFFQCHSSFDDLMRGTEQCDRNVYFEANGANGAFVPVWNGNTDIIGDTVSFDAWRDMTGFDEHSIVADPAFADPEKDDYRLKPESPALKRGFQPIDVTRIGPRTRA